MQIFSISNWEEQDRHTFILLYEIAGPHSKGRKVSPLVITDKGFLTSAGHTCLVGGVGAGCVQLQRRLQHCSSVMLVSGAVASSQPPVCRASAAPPPLPPPDRQATHIVPLTLGQQDITNTWQITSPSCTAGPISKKSNPVDSTLFPESNILLRAWQYWANLKFVK